MTEVRSVRVYDTPSGMGGSFTVSIVEGLPDGETVRLRVWYGRTFTARLGAVARLGRLPLRGEEIDAFQSTRHAAVQRTVIGEGPSVFGGYPPASPQSSVAPASSGCDGNEGSPMAPSLALPSHPWFQFAE